MNLPELFKIARNRACPLIAIETPDPASAIKTCNASLNGKADQTPIVRWDCLNGIVGLNAAGIAWQNEKSFDAMTTANPAEALAKLATDTPKGAVIFFSNAHRFIGNETVMQGVWNLRDIYAALPATLVLLAPSIVLPPELARDVVLLSEPLPTKAELKKDLDSILEDTKTNVPDFPDVAEDQKPALLDTLTGLSSFEAKQAIALSLKRTGLDASELWGRKVKQIEQTQGLTVYAGKEKFADIGGLENAKRIMGATVSGKMDVSCIVFLDEADKSFAAANTDSTGQTQDQNKALLSYMQDNKRPGVLFFGPPGTGKTIIAKATGNEYKKPTIFLDLGAMKSKYGGESEQAIRSALKIIHAVSDGRALFIAACNKSENLPPELRRRFNFCSLFFDLPDEAERKTALKIWTSKYKLTDAQQDWTPPEGWTGAEIENCALKAWAMNFNLSDAAKTIVPIAKSAADTVQALRRSASGKYISASKPGLYDAQAATTTTEPSTKREITL